MSITLTSEQSAVVNNRGGELLVSAAAGSGKTRVLVERLLSRVEQEGLDLDQFLVITFTKAAASELRDKILAELNQRLAQRPGDRHLKRQTTLIYRAQISTIHAFCTTFLRENSHLLDLDPDFRVADEQEAEALRTQTLDRVLERRYEELETNGFATLVDTLSAGRDDKRLVDITLDIHSRIQSHPDPERWLREQEAAFDLSGVEDVGSTRWGQLLLQDAQAQANYWKGQMVLALTLLDECGDDALYRAYADSFSGTLDGLRDFSAALEEGWDEARRYSQVPFPRLGGSRKVTDKLTQSRVKAVREKCKKSLSKLSDRFQCDSALHLEDMKAVAPSVAQLFRLVSDLQTAFQQAKRRRKLLDFNDLEHFTVKALVEDHQPTELARHWHSRWAEVMVDEYQDTNQVQNAIFDALTDGGKNLFQVGDIKQSIYRFRLADPTIFLRKYHTFAPAALAREGQPRLLVLSRNFRSGKAVLDAVNFVFEHIMSEAFGEIDYSEDQRLNPELSVSEGEGTDGVELNVVDLSTMEQHEQEANIPKDQVEARFVAQRVRRLLDEQTLISDGERLRPVRPEDIAILYRSPGAVLHYLTAALDEQNVPWQRESYEDFFRTTEVSVALSFLQIIDNPRQDVPLLSVLRGPVYGFTADQLASLRSACPGTDFYACVEKGALAGEEHCIRFLNDLKALRLRMVDTSCAQLLWFLYDQMGLLGLFGAMSGGQRRQENLLAFYDYARSFEGTGHRGVFAFVSQLRRLMERGRNPGVVSAATGSGVQIMSIHKSKGLEFPVVVLAGLNRQFNKTDENAPMLFHSRLGVGPRLLDPELRMEFSTLARTAVQLKINREMKAEELRLLYVAMTRAKERLIMVMSFRDAGRELGALMDSAGAHPAPEALSQLDSVGKWLLLPVLARRDARPLWDGFAPDTLLDTADHWDIRLVHADEDCFAPEVTEQSEEAPEEAPVPGEELLNALNWRYPWENLADFPSKVTATQMKGRLLDEEAAEETPKPAPPLEFRRPSFEEGKRPLTPAQAGSAIHAVMEHIDVDRADTVEGVKGELSRLVEQGFLTGEQAAVVNPAHVARFWASPLGVQAASSNHLRREFKFSILSRAAQFYPGADEAEEVLLQGVVDCCFEDLMGFTVVDFKSDRIRRGGERERAQLYRGQVEVYSRALEEIFHRPVVRRVLPHGTGD